MRKLTALAATLIFAFTTLAPAGASAERRRDGYDRGYHHDRGYDRHHRRHHDDDSDAVAAGAIGLVLGLAIGSLAAESSARRAPEARCYDNYQRCAPPPGYYDQGYQGYDPRYSPPPPPPQAYYADPYRSSCMRRERQWDRYANQYVTVDVPC